MFENLSSLEVLEVQDNQLRSLPDRVFFNLSSLRMLRLEGNPGAPFTLRITPEQITPDTFVIRIAQGAPFDLTATVMLTGATLPDGTPTGQMTISAGRMTSVPITPSTGNVVVVTLSDPSPLPSFSAFTRTGFSGLEIAVSAPLTMTTAVEERIKDLNRNILPEVGRELMVSVQTAVTGRIDQVFSGEVVLSPTLQLAGRSTLSDLLLFGAQTLEKTHHQDQTSAP